MKIKNIEITDFKGTKSATYDFGSKSVRVSGRNGSGKTTIADAFFYLFCSRDNALNKNPEIFPIDAEEAKPTVRCTVEIDGVDHVLSKWQVRKKKEKSDGTVEVSTVNEYSINEVPKNATTFDAFLNEHGVDTTTFLQFSHPEVFVAQMDSKKDRDAMRSTLFSMANSHTDVEIASMDDSTKAVAELLTKYSMDEVRAMYTAQRKKAVENVENIPQQIIGLEMAKVDSDVAEVELEKADLERQIAEIDEQMKAGDTSSEISKLKAEKAEYEATIRQISTNATTELITERAKLKNAICDLENKLHELENKKLILQKQIEDCNKILSDEYKNRDEYHARYDEALHRVFDESAWEFDESSEYCHSCGQRLPKDKIAEIRAKHSENYAIAKKNFENTKKSIMDEMIQAGNQSRAISSATEDRKQIAMSDMEEITTLLDRLNEQHADMVLKHSNMPISADISSNEEVIALNEKIATIVAQINSISNPHTIDTELSEKRLKLTSELNLCNERIAAVANNVRIDEQISALRNEQLTAEQKKADAERILYQLDLVSKKKNSMLSDEINKHFDLVDFIFFDYQKNGNYTEVCLPTINGKRLGESMNTGLALMAKLDIIRGLQKFYGAEIPVFVDGAECLDSMNLKKIPNDIQMIFLNVSDGNLEVEEL